MWLVILVSCILMGPVLWIFINRLQPLATRGRKVEPPVEARMEREGMSLKMCYWFVYGALLKQGFTSDPKSGVGIE